MLKKCIQLFILCFVIENVNAQVIHINELDSLWHLKISATGFYSDGNAPKTVLTNKLKITKVNNAIGLISNFTYQYGTVSSANKIVYNDFRFENTLLLYPKKRFNPFLRTFEESNIIRKINFRNEIALGLVSKILSEKEHAINLVLAGVNQQTNYNFNKFNLSNFDNNDKINTWKGMAGVSGLNSIVKNKLRAEYRLYWMQGFDEMKNYSYLIDVSLEFILNKHISLQTNYINTFENLEPIGVLPFETQLTYGLSITL